MVFKNWKSLEKNTERRREGEERERGVDGETEREKRKGGGGETSSADWSQVVI